VSRPTSNSAVGWSGSKRKPAPPQTGISERSECGRSPSPVKRTISIPGGANPTAASSRAVLDEPALKLPEMARTFT